MRSREEIDKEQTTILVIMLIALAIIAIIAVSVNAVIKEQTKVGRLHENDSLDGAYNRIIDSKQAYNSTQLVGVRK